MFRFKQFTINQERSAMKVGTDGVLLGAWVSLRGDERKILDIGTGTGVIALMMAQRSEAAEIDGVEIEAESAEEASENIAASKWSDRVQIINSDIKSYAPNNEGYDLIVSNPPYFVDSLLSPNANRTTARHTTELSFEELTEAVARLLSPNGRFGLILPTTESQRFEQAAEGKLSPIRRCEVYSRAGGEVKRIMCEYQLCGAVNPVVADETITIESGRPPQFTEEYKEVTREFYLKF